MKIKISRSCNWTNVEAVLETTDENYQNDLAELEMIFEHFSNSSYETTTEVKKPKKQLKKPIRMATPAQIKLLDKYGLLYDGEDGSNISFDEAYSRIQENMGC